MAGIFYVSKSGDKNQEPKTQDSKNKGKRKPRIKKGIPKTKNPEPKKFQAINFKGPRFPSGL
jgi:hypothetical protein